MEERELKIDNLVEIQKEGDFITSIKTSNNYQSLCFIHEKNTVDVSSEEFFPQSTQLHFESNVYDCETVAEGSMIVSNKNMPVRVYSLGKGGEVSWATIYDKKPNSELFLAPLELAKNGDTIVGGGKKFLSSYDIAKTTARRIKSMDKKYISSLDLIDPNTIITGQFAGELQILDLRSSEIVSSRRPHMDLVTRIKSRPLAQHHFVSLARKDNFSYLWDMRKLDQFVACFQHQRHKNQRTGLALSLDGNYLYMGGEKGELFVHNLSNPAESSRFELNINKCLNSISCTQKHLYVSLGERDFPLEGEQSYANFLMVLSLR